MSKKVEIVSITKTEFVQSPDEPSHPQGKEMCAYCKHAHISKPPCCSKCRTTVKTSDGKIFSTILSADCYCIEKNKG